MWAPGRAVRCSARADNRRPAPRLAHAVLDHRLVRLHGRGVIAGELNQRQLRNGIADIGAGAVAHGLERQFDEGFREQAHCQRVGLGFHVPALAQLALFTLAVERQANGVDGFVVVGGALNILKSAFAYREYLSNVGRDITLPTVTSYSMNSMPPKVQFERRSPPILSCASW